MIRYRVEYVLLRSVLAVFGAMPAPVASGVGGALFRAIGPRMGISKIGRRNIARTFPSWSEREVEACLRGMWDNLGRVVAEYPHLDTLARKYTTFRNPEAFQALKASGKGVVFVSGHMANWEVYPPAILAQQGLAMHSAYRAPNNPLVDRLLVGFRSYGGRLRSFGKTRKGLGDILKALQNHETVGMLIDQKMNTGIEAPFFGRPAMTSTAFVELARKTGCPLVPGRLVRTHGCHFEAELAPHVTVGDRPTPEVVADVHATLEGWISEYPAQWLWIHRRWIDSKTA